MKTQKTQNQEMTVVDQMSFFESFVPFCGRLFAAARVYPFIPYSWRLCGSARDSESLAAPLGEACRSR
jgi:hypothetical protein